MYYKTFKFIWGRGGGVQIPSLSEPIPFNMVWGLGHVWYNHLGKITLQR